jgi:hypothetical protein
VPVNLGYVQDNVRAALTEKVHRLPAVAHERHLAARVPQQNPELLRLRAVVIDNKDACHAVLPAWAWHGWQFQGFGVILMLKRASHPGNAGLRIHRRDCRAE